MSDFLAAALLPIRLARLVHMLVSFVNLAVHIEGAQRAVVRRHELICEGSASI